MVTRHDLRSAMRSLVRRPGFSAITVATLALGIGTTAAVFSVVDGILLKPLPFPSADRLVFIASRFDSVSGRELTRYPVGSPEYFDYRAQNRTMEGVAGYSQEVATLVPDRGEPEVLSVGVVTASLFPLLRTQAVCGRTLMPRDDGPESPWAVVLSHALWQRAYGGDTGIVGREIDLELGDAEETIHGPVVGVMPEGFTFPGTRTDLWVSLRLDPTRTWRGGHWFMMLGRLSPSVTLGEAQSEMVALMTHWAEEFPEHHVGHGLYLAPLLDDTVGDVSRALFVLFLASGMVLLIACANASGLLLAHGEARRQEFGVRSALGGCRTRLLRLPLTESAVLSGLGGVAGIALARAGVSFVQRLGTDSVPRLSAVSVDTRTVLFTLGASVVAALLSGLVPALRAARVHPAELLRHGGRSLSIVGSRFRRTLVVGEIALAVLVTTAAGLLARTFHTVVSVDAGFETSDLVALELSLPAGRYGPEPALQFFTNLRDRISSLPGVVTASVVSRPPLLRDRSSGHFIIEGRGDSDTQARLLASRVGADPSLEATLGVRLVSGRFLADEDRANTANVVVIDETMASRYWPGTNPIGQRIRFARFDGPWHTIVGVVRGIRWDGPEQPALSFYHPVAQAAELTPFAFRDMTLLLRTRPGIGPLDESLRRLVRELDPMLPIRGPISVDDIVSLRASPRLFSAKLLAGFSGIALLLGGIGMFALLSHETGLRRREIAIRMALGAETGTVARQVLSGGWRLLLTGTALGLAAAFATRFLIAGLLYEVSPSDPVTYLVVAATAFGIGLGAISWPALKAARTDLSGSLRSE